MTQFIYNNAKKTSIVYISFELKGRFYLRASYKKDVDLCFQLKSADKLRNKLKKLMTIYRKNFYHIQEL